MRVLVACERSGVVREAFRRRGHDAWSCDLVPADDGSHFHILGDAEVAVWSQWWDMLVAFPPCTCLASSGARWMVEKRFDGRQKDALGFIWSLMSAPVDKIAVENPIGIISSQIRKPDQIIQPWMFGHGETKATCLWLKNLPCLVPTDIVGGREQRVWKMAPSPERARLRSQTYQGIAEAMADQWGAR